MKQVYSGLLCLRVLLIAALVSISQLTNAQNPTVIMQSIACDVVEAFTDNDGGFTSPSIYSSDDDANFFWIDANDRWESDSGLVVRDASIISGVYTHTEEGGATLGFYYEAPAGSQYRIRLIAVTGGPIEILANTNNGPLWDNLPGTSGGLCLRLSDLDLHVGQQLRYEVSFRAFAPGPLVFDEFAMAEQAIPLPVTFLGFTSRKENGNVKLKWDVAEEYNVRGYEVERSQDGVRFSMIGFVPAGAKDAYSFLDVNSQPGANYYRVRNVDYDGSYKYTHTIKVVNGKGGNLRLFPVPAKNQVTIQHEKSTSQSVITINGADGRIVKRVTLTANSYQTVLDITTLGSGLYIVKYDDGAGNVESIKLIKN